MPPSETSVASGAWLEKDGFLLEPRLRALGLKHGFSTRRLGDLKDRVKLDAAAALLGVERPVTLKQVHGTTIRRAAHSAEGLDGDGWTLGPGDEGVTVAVYTADCVPLYLWSDDGRFAGVFHAGWKGTAAGMPGAAVRALVERGAERGSLRAAFGPHIGVEAYKVGPDLEHNFPPSAFVKKADGLHLDLWAEGRRQLLEAGVPAAGIGPAGPCTYSSPDSYYSFRRDKQGARMLAFLSLDRCPS